VGRSGNQRRAARREQASQVQIDSDTKGVPGTPPITETILKKIEGCDLFVPDLTFVARTANGKYVPNPNVMAEFGYALHAKTYAALMPIMNTAFGPAEELPFDLGHLRHPIQYHVEATAGDAERRRVRGELSRKIEERLRLQIAAKQFAWNLFGRIFRGSPSHGKNACCGSCWCEVAWMNPMPLGSSRKRVSAI
jgi:hypothetical protein